MTLRKPYMSLKFSSGADYLFDVKNHTRSLSDQKNNEDILREWN